MTRAERLEAAAAMWAGGSTMAEISVRLSLSPSAVNNIVRRNRERFPRRLDDRSYGTAVAQRRAGLIERACKLIAEGRNQRQAADELGVNYSTLYDWLRREPQALATALATAASARNTASSEVADIDQPPAPKVASAADRSPTEANVETAVRLWAGNATLSDIADRIGMSRNAVAGMVARYRDRFPRRRSKPAAPVEAGVPVVVRPAPRKPVPAAPCPVAPETKRDAPRKVAPAGQDGTAPLEFVPAKSEAFRPLPNRAPARLLIATGCRWPVHVDGDPLREATTLVCDAPVGVGKTPYCRAHLAIAFGRGSSGERDAHRISRSVR